MFSRETWRNIAIAVVVIILLLLVWCCMRQPDKQSDKIVLSRTGWAQKADATTLPWKFPTSYYVVYEDSKFTSSTGPQSNSVSGVSSATDTNPTFNSGITPAGITAVVYRSVDTPNGDGKFVATTLVPDAKGNFTDTDNPYKLPNGASVTFAQWNTVSTATGCAGKQCRPWKTGTNYAMAYKDAAGNIGAIGAPSGLQGPSETDNTPSFTFGAATPSGFTPVIYRSTTATVDKTSPVIVPTTLTATGFTDADNLYQGPGAPVLTCTSFEGGAPCTPPAGCTPPSITGSTGKCLDKEPWTSGMSHFIMGWPDQTKVWEDIKCPANWDFNVGGSQPNNCTVRGVAGGTGAFLHSEVVPSVQNDTPCPAGTYTLTGPTKPFAIPDTSATSVCIKW